MKGIPFATDRQEATIVTVSSYCEAFTSVQKKLSALSESDRPGSFCPSTSMLPPPLWFRPFTFPGIAAAASRRLVYRFLWRNNFSKAVTGCGVNVLLLASSGYVVRLVGSTISSFRNVYVFPMLRVLGTGEVAVMLWGCDCYG